LPSMNVTDPRSQLTETVYYVRDADNKITEPDL